jgi:hypothetical protein
MGFFFLLGGTFFSGLRSTPVAGLAESNPLFEVFHDLPPFGEGLYHRLWITAIIYGVNAPSGWRKAPSLSSVLI